MNTKSLRSYLLTGLVVWLPVLITIGVLQFLINLLDSTLALIPKAYQPDTLLGFHIPGLGVILSLLILIMTGLVATNYFGQKLVQWGESILDNIPIIRSIYKTVKQVINAILSTNSEAFRKVVMVEYPRKGLWSLAFLTGSMDKKMNQALGEELVSLFVPTTPNPTSGFLMMLPKKELIEVDMSIDEALKCIISLGVMQPKTGSDLTSKESTS